MNYVNLLGFAAWIVVAIVVCFMPRYRLPAINQGRGEIYIHPTQAIWIFVFGTGLLAFSWPGPVDVMAIRLLVVEVMLGLVVAYNYNKLSWTWPLAVYGIYIVWIIAGCLWSTAPAMGLRVVLKYMYAPLVFMAAVVCVRNVNMYFWSVTAAVATGVLAMGYYFIPGIEWRIRGFFWYFTAAGINFICLALICCAWARYGIRRPLWILAAGTFAVIPIIWGLRTSLVALAAGATVMAVMLWRKRAFLVVCGILGMAAVCFYYVPSLYEKSFPELEPDTEIQLMALHKLHQKKDALLEEDDDFAYGFENNDEDYLGNDLIINAATAGLLTYDLELTEDAVEQLFDIIDHGGTSSADLARWYFLNTNARIGMWEKLWDRFYGRAPLTGNGTGTVQAHMYGSGDYGTLTVAHNDWLQMLLDGGWIAVGLYLAAVGGAVGQCFRWVHNSVPVGVRICAVAAGSALAAVSMAMFTENCVNYSLAVMTLPWGLYGMAVGMSAQSEETKQVKAIK